jgi:hypothetical protein
MTEETTGVGMRVHDDSEEERERDTQRERQREGDDIEVSTVDAGCPSPH